jgi:hypothetical protein
MHTIRNIISETERSIVVTLKRNEGAQRIDQQIAILHQGARAGLSFYFIIFIDCFPGGFFSVFLHALRMPFLREKRPFKVD